MCPRSIPALALLSSELLAVLSMFTDRNVVVLSNTPCLKVLLHSVVAPAKLLLDEVVEIQYFLKTMAV